MKKYFIKTISCFILFSFNYFHAQIITTIAGTGVGSYTGDNGPATSATMSEPRAVAIDGSGNVFIADEDDNVIRKINSLTGIITTIAGNGTIGYSGNNGPATSAKMNGPSGLAFDAKGNLFVSDAFNNVIRKIDTAGIITTYAGNNLSGFSGDNGNATSAALNLPLGIAFDKAGNLFIADAANNRIRIVDTSGIIKTFAGTGAPTYGGDNGPATLAKLFYPNGIIVDTSSGKIYIADSNNHRVRVVDTSGTISTFAGNGTMNFGGDGGQATSAQLNNPQDVKIDLVGNIFIADAGNSVIRKIDPSGIISSYAGNHTSGYSGDGGPAIYAQLHSPPGIATDIAGNLYIAEYFNARVRKVSFCANPISLGITGIKNICSGDSTTLSVNGAVNYLWGANTGNDTGTFVSVNPTVNTFYVVTGINGQCAVRDSAEVIVSPCAGINSVRGTENNFSVFPNPANGEITIMNLEKNCSIEIFNAEGKKIQEEKISDEKKIIQLPNEKGIYLLRIISGNKIEQHKIVKE